MVNKLPNQVINENEDHSTRVVSSSDILFPCIESAKILAQTLKEGSVNVQILELVLVGPPAVGKTSFLHLLFNKPGPKYHNSTAIASESFHTINIWERMKGIELLRRVMEVLTNFSDYEVDNRSTPNTPHSMDKCINYAFTSVQYADQEDITSVEPTATKVTSDATNLDPESDSDAPYYSDQILDILAKGNTSKELHASTWIHIIDSGGQPQFADISRAFFRGNSLNVIVTKLNEFLSDKPKFLYSVDGQVVHQPSLLQMTNLQVIEYFVRSIVSAKHTVAKSFHKLNFKPLFCIVGTNYDCSYKMTTLFKELETLHEKNSQLLHALHEFRDHLIFYNESEDQLIFPVDNTSNLWNKNQIYEDICKCITSYKNVTAEVEIPIRWYFFESCLKKVAEKVDHGIVPLSRCLEIGQELKMKASDTTLCIEYLNLSLVLYFPDVLDNVVFTNPQYLVTLVTSIIRASCVDPVKCKIFKDCAPYPGWNQQLRHKGIFESKLPDALQDLKFVEGLFTKDNFLALMEHLCIISPLNDQQYFIPAALPISHISEEEKKYFKKASQPMLLQFESKVVPQVSDVINSSTTIVML